MATLSHRLEQLEKRVLPRAQCFCARTETVCGDGQVESPTPPVCPHGRPWWIVFHIREVPRGHDGGCDTRGQRRDGAGVWAG
jgi:hypothetical protein